MAGARVEGHRLPEPRRRGAALRSGNHPAAARRDHDLSTRARPLRGRVHGGTRDSIAQIVRHRIEVLYPTTLLLRLVLIGTIVALYVESGDPLFLVLTAIVGLGMVLTTAGLLSDRRTRGPTG